MPSHGLENVNILEQEVDFTIHTTGKREIELHPENEEDEVLYLAQNDSGSTRIIFEIPRMIGNHDTYECDQVQIHYINVGSSTLSSRDIYSVTDLQPVQTWEEHDDYIAGRIGVEIDDYTSMLYLLEISKFDYKTMGFWTASTDPDTGKEQHQYEEIVYNETTKKYELESPVAQDPSKTYISCNRIVTLVILDQLNNNGDKYIIKYTGTSTDLFKKDKYYEYVPKDEQLLRFSWTVGNTATEYNGSVHFAIHFICLDENDTTKIKYDWCTGICDDIQVFGSMDNSESIEKTYSEMLLQWRDQLMFTPEWTQNLENTDEDFSVLTLVRQWDGVSVSSPKSLRGPQGIKGDVGAKGEKGDTGLIPELEVGKVWIQDVANPTPSVEINYANPDDKSKAKMDFVLPSSTKCVDTIEGSGADYPNLYFFVGTSEEYDKLDPAVTANKNLFAIKTDDTTEEEFAETIDKINSSVSEHTSDITEIKHTLEALPNQPSKVYNYVWTDAGVIDNTNTAFPAMAEKIGDAWEPKADGLVVYEFFTDSNGDGEGDTLIETRIVQAPEDMECPSNYDDGEQWWKIYPHSPYNFIKSTGDFMDYSNKVRVSTEFKNVLEASITVGGVTKKFESITDGAMVVFEDTTADLNHPDRYNGYSIRRVAILKKEYDEVYSEERWNVYIQTHIQADPNWRKSQTDANLLKQISNDKNIFKYDVIGNRPEVVKTIAYRYRIGAPALLCTITMISCDEPETGNIDGPNDKVFTHTNPDFLNYLTREGYKLNVSDYIIDANDDLYKIANPPVSGSGSIQLLRVTRNSKRTQETINDVSCIKSLLEDLYTVNKIDSQNTIYFYNKAGENHDGNVVTETDRFGITYTTCSIEPVTQDNYANGSKNYRLINVATTIGGSSFSDAALSFINKHFSTEILNEGKPDTDGNFKVKVAFDYNGLMADVEENNNDLFKLWNDPNRTYWIANAVTFECKLVPYQLTALTK